MSHAKILCLFAGAAFTSSAIATETTVSKDEVRAIVAEMMSNAQGQTSLLRGGSGGYDDKGFFLADDAGKFRMGFNGAAKFRYTINFRDNGGIANLSQANPGTGGGGYPRTSFNSGFSMRDIALKVSGHAITKDFEYCVQFRAQGGAGIGGGADNPLAIDDVYFKYKGIFGNDWYLKGGQYKTAFMRESAMNDNKILGSERSVVDAAFSAGRTQGLVLGYADQNMHLQIRVDDGFNSANTGWASTSNGSAFPAVPGVPAGGGQGAQPTPAGAPMTTPISGSAAFAFGARFDWVVSGAMAQLDDATCEPSQPEAFGVGAAFNYQQSRRGIAFSATDQDTNNLSWTVDAQYENNGFSAMAAVVGSWNRVYYPIGATPTKFSGTNWGVMVQGAYRWSPTCEVFARYDGLYLTSNLGPQVLGPGAAPMGPKNYNFVTFGYNHYFSGHAAKFTADCIMSLNPTATFIGGQTNSLMNIVASGANTGAATAVNRLGLLGTSKGIECALRFQFQWLF